MRHIPSLLPAPLLLACALSAFSGCEHKQSAKPLDAVASARKAQEDRKIAAAQALNVTPQGACLLTGVLCTEFAGSSEAELAKLRTDCENGTRKGTWVPSCQRDGANSACKVSEGAATTVSWFMAGVSAGEARLQCNGFGAHAEFFEL